MNNTTFKRISKVTVVALGFSLIVLGGCAGQGDTTSSNDIAVKVFSGLTGTCDNTTYAGQGLNGHPMKSVVFTGQGLNGRSAIFAGQGLNGGKQLIAAQTNSSCSNFTVDISGSIQGADSVLINLNGQDIAVSVGADGTFHAQIPADVAPANVTVTPMISGNLGVSLVVSPTQV